jgi:hypothetical protein
MFQSTKSSQGTQALHSGASNSYQLWQWARTIAASRLGAIYHGLQRELGMKELTEGLGRWQHLELSSAFWRHSSLSCQVG